MKPPVNGDYAAPKDPINNTRCVCCGQDPCTRQSADYVSVPLVLLEFIAERFIDVDVADGLALAAVKSYVEAAKEEKR